MKSNSFILLIVTTTATFWLSESFRPIFKGNVIQAQNFAKFTQSTMRLNCQNYPSRIVNKNSIFDRFRHDGPKLLKSVLKGKSQFAMFRTYE